MNLSTEQKDDSVEDYDLSKVKNPELVSFMNDLLRLNDRIKMEESVKDITSHYGGTNPND